MATSKSPLTLSATVPASVMLCRNRTLSLSMPVSTMTASKACFLALFATGLHLLPLNWDLAFSAIGLRQRWQDRNIALSTYTLSSAMVALEPSSFALFDIALESPWLSTKIRNSYCSVSISLWPRLEGFVRAGLVEGNDGNQHLLPNSFNSLRRGKFYYINVYLITVNSFLIKFYSTKFYPCTKNL